MNHTLRPRLVATPPPLKTRLLTRVQGFTAAEQHLDLRSPSGKRTLFRHRVWVSADRAFPQWRTLHFSPGWLVRLAGGAQAIKRSEVCPAGRVGETLAQLQEAYAVELYGLTSLRPGEASGDPDAPYLRYTSPPLPRTWAYGNHFWRGVSRHSDLCFAGVAPLWRGALKGVGA